MSELFDFFSQQKVGIFVLAGVVFALMVVLQWICWIFRWGRFKGEKSEAITDQIGTRAAARSIALSFWSTSNL